MNTHNNKRLILGKTTILASSMTALLLAVLFPPWLRPVVLSGKPSYVRCWIGSSPNYYGAPGFVLAWDRLLVECMFIFSIMLVLLIGIHFLDKRVNSPR
jgi:hypothetical protein